MRHSIPIALVVGAAILVGSTASAQSNNENFISTEFDFSLPGARSLGMGGAFVGLADDATAAWANPGGLLSLNKFEISVEARAWRFSTVTPDHGTAIFDLPSRTFERDTLEDFQSTNTTGSPSYVSLVYPKGNWRVAAFRHQLAKYKATPRGSGPAVRLSGESGSARNLGLEGDMELDIAEYGVAFARRLGGGVSLGIGVSLQEFSLDSISQRFLPDGTRPMDFSDNNLYLDTIDAAKQRKAAFTAGLHWRTQSGQWAAGAAYRYGPRFEFDSATTAGLGGQRALPGFYRAGELVADPLVLSYDLPDALAAGLSFRSGGGSGRLLVTTEFGWLRYSQLSRDTAEVLGIGNAPCTPSVLRSNPGCRPFPGDPSREILSQAESANLLKTHLKFPDVAQLRLGVEYAFAAPLLVRAGAWYDPDHRMRFETGDLSDRVLRANAVVPLIFQPGDNQVHFSAGLGLAWPKFQIDGAADVSDRINSYSVSMVLRP